MKRIIIPVLVFLFVFFMPGQTNAQFLKKLKNKVEEKLDQVLETDESAEETDKTSSDTSKDNTYDASEITADYGDFVSGNTIVFSDMPEAGEQTGKTPSKWFVFNKKKSDNTEIVEVNNKKMIRVAKSQGISPLISGKEKDYIPENCTIEFDASFSANSSDQRYYIAFYDLENQNDFVAYEVRDNELTLKTFGVTDNLTEGTLKGHKYNEKSSKPVWRHIAIKYQNNTFDVYYDGEHVFHKQDVKGNLIGLTISRSDFGSDDRYIKNVTIATNL